MSYQKDGVAIGDLVQLGDVGGGTPGLPAVDGSLLTGITATAAYSLVNITNADSPYAVPGNVTHIIAECTAGAVVVSLPTAAIVRQLIVARASTDTSQVYNVTLTPNGADTVSGEASQLVYRNESFMMVANGVSDWVVI